jgi:Spy/CpxP family protein refolding chaperone
MKRNILLIGLAAAGLTAFTIGTHTALGMPGMEHRHPPMMGGGPGRLIPLLLHSADLTADQETQVHQLLDADRPAVQQIVSQLRQANDDLANLLLGSQGVQADAVAAQQVVIAGLQQQLAQHETNAVLAIRALLSPDQLAKANAAKEQAEACRAEEFGPPDAH